MFLYPWWLSLLILVPAAAWQLFYWRTQPSLQYSSAASTWNQSLTWRQRLSWLPGALLLVALTMMVISLARPRHGREQTVVQSEGIAIEMVVDRSGSMQALDFQIDGRHVDRLTAIKNVASKFVLGDRNDSDFGDDPKVQEDGVESDVDVQGRFSDLIGLITFAGYADAIAPPTLDHPFLVAQLENTEIVRNRSEDGTAIGDAISLAVDKLSSLEKTVSSNDPSTDDPSSRGVQSKVIILLTDGENTAGKIEPAEAAELAKALGIKVYTIGVGTKGRAPFPVRRTRSGEVLVDYVNVNIDEATLKGIAKQTGGRYFRATDTRSLETIYEEIDRLEKVQVETQRYFDYREMAVQFVRVNGWLVPPLLLVALLCLAASALLKQTIFRQLS